MIVASSLSLATGVCWAQRSPSSVDAAVRISRAQEENALAIRNCTWTQRTEIEVEGEAKPAQLQPIDFQGESGRADAYREDLRAVNPTNHET